MKKTGLIIAAIACLLAGSAANSYAQNADPDVIKVYRWYNPDDDQYSIAAEDEYNDEELKRRGWEEKEVLFYAYRTRKPNTVPVYSWYHPKYRNRISVREDEFSEMQMRKRGYTNRHLQFYALTRPYDNTVRVFRCQHEGSSKWVTITNDEYLDRLQDKVFQYYAVSAKKK